MKVSASILSCDFSNLKNELSVAENSKLDFVHLDIMDGHFVPNISFGPHVAHCIDKISNVPSEVHLMVSNPLKFIDKFPLSKKLSSFFANNTSPVVFLSSLELILIDLFLF